MQARHLFQQCLQGDNHAARGRAQLVDVVAAHLDRLGERRIQAIFDGDGLHIGVIGSDIRSGQEDI